MNLSNADSTEAKNMRNKKKDMESVLDVSRYSQKRNYHGSASTQE